MTNIKLFHDKKIRSVWNDEEQQWYFVGEDIIFALTDSADPKQYLKRMKLHDKELTKAWVQIVPILSVQTPGGKQKMRCANNKTLFWKNQSQPSVKAEPFKLWISQKDSKRIQDILKIKIESIFSKKFGGGDSVFIFETDDKKAIKYGNALHRDKEILFFD